MAENKVPLYINFKREVDGKVEYLVRWQNSTTGEKTWELESNLNCPNLIKRIEAEISIKPGLTFFNDNVPQISLLCAVKNKEDLFFVIKILGKIEVVKITHEEGARVWPHIINNHFEEKLKMNFQDENISNEMAMIVPIEHIDLSTKNIMRHLNDIANGTYDFPKIFPDDGERTFIIIKYEGVKHGLINQIINTFEQNGLKLVGQKFLQPSKSLLEKQYALLKGPPVFTEFINEMSSGPVAPMVWEGFKAVKICRQLLGSPNLALALPSSICGDFSKDCVQSIVHSSDSIESAKKEISLWFEENELVKTPFGEEGY